MKFRSTLDELHHWIGLLRVDIQLGAAQRHINATARLCWLLVDKLEQDPAMRRDEFTLLSLSLLDLQRQIDPVKRVEPKGIVKGPRLSLVPRS